MLSYWYNWFCGLPGEIYSSVYFYLPRTPKEKKKVSHAAAHKLFNNKACSSVKTDILLGTKS